MVGLQIESEDRNAFHNVVVLATAKAIVGAQLPMHFILGGLAGAYLSTSPCFATLPVSMIIIGSTVTAPFLSTFMQKFGRKFGLERTIPTRSRYTGPPAGRPRWSSSACPWAVRGGRRRR